MEGGSSERGSKVGDTMIQISVRRVVQALLHGTNLLTWRQPGEQQSISSFRPPSNLDKG